MTKEELQKELELLADSCDSNYALEVNGYSRGVLDALDVVNKYFALAPVSGLLCGTCTDFKIVGKVFVCKKCGKEQKSISA
mgnify:CR=1 FL=1